MRRVATRAAPRARLCPGSAGLNGRLPGGVLANQERGATAAGCDDVRVVDDEAGTLEAVDVVDLGAEDELHAHLVDDDRNALVLEDVIVGLGLIEGERVLEARTAAAAHRDAQRLLLGIDVRADQLLNLARRLVGELNCRLWSIHRFRLYRQAQSSSLRYFQSRYWRIRLESWTTSSPATRPGPRRWRVSSSISGREFLR